jgi:UDP-GlcNAc:undecaprenyl-phosphate GlcNAc-1-phosphate transferase
MIAQVTSTRFTADQVLSPYVYVFYAAFIVSFIFTPLMRMIAIYFGVIDQPDQKRKFHKAPIAYLGGVAVFLGWLAGMAISQQLQLHRIEPGWPTDFLVIKFSIVLGAAVIVLLGLWDDLYKVTPGIKIATQIFAAALLLYDGVGTTCLAPILQPVSIKLTYYLGVPPISMTVITLLSSLLVVGVIVGCCNASNLMDGMDGLCGGVTAIIAAGFLFVAVNLAMYGGGLHTNADAMRIVIPLALLGAVLGFVPYNFNPASIFLGDTGSMFLGFSCGTMIILMAEERPKWFLAAMVMFALPVLDTSLAFARRWVGRRPLFSADSQHFHHQLQQRGFTVRQTVLIEYGLAFLFALLGASMVFLRTRYAGALYMVIFGSIIVAAYKMGMVHERKRLHHHQRRKTDGHSSAPIATEDPTSTRSSQFRS